MSRRWEREWIIDRERGGRFSTSIEGEAVSEKDNVCVIGKERETKRFSLTIRSDEDAAQEWEWIRREEGIAVLNDSSTPELRRKARIGEALNKMPPTATLFVTDADWELGSKGGWSIECQAPPSVLARLEAEVIMRHTHELYIGIHWVAGLVRDEYAPPSYPTSWGLFTLPQGHGPEALRGYVQSLAWRISEKASTIVQPETPAPHVDENQVELDREIVRLGNMVSIQIAGLARVCAIGFFAVLALIVLIHLLR